MQSVIVEYFPCRRFLKDSKLWLFDFDMLTDKLIETIPKKHVVIPEYYLVQNIRPDDFSKRIMLAAFGGNPITAMKEEDIYPDGIVNDTCFPALGNPIECMGSKIKLPYSSSSI